MKAVFELELYDYITLLTALNAQLAAQQAVSKNDTYTLDLRDVVRHVQKAELK